MKKKTLLLLLAAGAIFLAALYTSIYILEQRRGLESEFAELTKDEIVARASIGVSITPDERSKFDVRDWTLHKEFVSEKKGRIDFRVVAVGMDGICLTAYRKSNGLAILVHKDCPFKPIN